MTPFLSRDSATCRIHDSTIALVILCRRKHGIYLQSTLNYMITLTFESFVSLYRCSFVIRFSHLRTFESCTLIWTDQAIARASERHHTSKHGSADREVFRKPHCRSWGRSFVRSHDWFQLTFRALGTSPSISKYTLSTMVSR